MIYMSEEQLKLIHDAMDEVVMVLKKNKDIDLTTLLKAQTALTELEQLVSDQVKDSEYEQADIFSDRST